MNINNIHSIFQILLSGVSQGSNLRPRLFSIFISDLLYSIKEAQLLSFVDGNSIATFANSVDAIDWFCSNEMVVNPHKFQSVIINRLGKLKNSYELLIDNHKIDSENSVTLLGIEIDNKLNFGEHVTTVCQKVGRQLYIITVDFRNRKPYLSVLYSQILFNAPLCGILALPPCHRK